MGAAERAEVVARTALCLDWEGLAHTSRVVDHLGPEATDDERAVAWLHDVVEDTDVTLADLEDIGFAPEVVEAVRLLTREHQQEGDGSDYRAYKDRLFAARGEAGRLARAVKLADASENLDRCKRAYHVPKWERLARERYQPLVYALENLIAQYGEER